MSTPTLIPTRTTLLKPYETVGNNITDLELIFGADIAFHFVKHYMSVIIVLPGELWRELKTCLAPIHYRVIVNCSGHEPFCHRWERGLVSVATNGRLSNGRTIEELPETWSITAINGSEGRKYSIKIAEWEVVTCPPDLLELARILHDWRKEEALHKGAVKYWRRRIQNSMCRLSE